MAIRIAPYSEQHVAAVKEFNKRLREGGAPADYVFSESPVPGWLPHSPGAPVYNEFYVALEGDAVRGAYALKHQQFSFHGEIRPLVYLHHPFSEAVVNKKYAQVGVQMLMRAIREHAMLFALGMGGYDQPLPRILMALHWKHCLIPFYFRVNHPARFLRNIQVLQQSPKKRFIANAAAITGAGWAGLKFIQSVRGWSALRRELDFEIVEEFDNWADDIWHRTSRNFAMIAVRDTPVLRTLYPASNRNFIRLKLIEQNRAVGWAVVAERRKPRDPQYGDLRVGVILDALAPPEYADRVIAAATNALIERDVDLITSNQSHQAWRRALTGCGFFKGPSNFIFAAAKSVSDWLEPFAQNVPLSHLNRGDGDNLLQY